MCKAYDSFIPKQYLKRALKLIFQENSFEFNGKSYLQIHGTAMGTKMAVAFANIFLAEVETQILNQSALKPLVWKRYIDDIFSIWNVNKDDVTQFIKQANNHHPTIKFTAEISHTETTFLDTNVFKVATHQGSKRASSKAKHSDFSEQIPQKQKLKLKSHNSKHILEKEDTQKHCFRQSSQRSSMKTENLPFNKNEKKTRESCLSLHDTVQRCLT